MRRKQDKYKAPSKVDALAQIARGGTTNPSADCRITITESSAGNDIGGSCSHNSKTGKTSSLTIPKPKTAMDRWIALHEMLHSRYSARVTAKQMAFSAQIAEDILIHYCAQRNLKTPDFLRADGMTTALLGIREAQASTAKTGQIGTMARGIFLRSILLAENVAHGGTPQMRDGYRRTIEASAKQEKYLWLESERLERVKMLARRLSNRLGELEEKPRNAKRKTAVDETRELLIEAVRVMIEEPVKTKTKTKSAGNGEGEEAPKIKGEFGERGTVRPKFELSERCRQSRNTLTRTITASGSKLRRRNVAGIATNPTGRVFTRSTRSTAPSAIMLDLSSSMKWGADRLMRLCHALPETTVYGYCDEQFGKHGNDGSVFVLAEKGRRVSALPPTIESFGNGTDLQAVQQLCKHRGDIVLVSDLHFCGQDNRATMEAHRIVESTKRMRVITSSDAYLQELEA